MNDSPGTARGSNLLLDHSGHPAETQSVSDANVWLNIEVKERIDACEATTVGMIAVCALLSLGLFSVDAEAAAISDCAPGPCSGDGKPANDMPLGGVYGRHRLDAGWWLGLALDYSEFDVERPNRVLGLMESEETDSIAEGWFVTGWIEREFKSDSDGMRPFLLVEVGVGIIDVPDVVIPLEGGAEVDLKIDADTEILLGFGGGVRLGLRDNWFIEPIFRFDFHFADWSITDQTSGRRGSVGDYATWTGQLGLGRRLDSANPIAALRLRPRRAQEALQRLVAYG